MTDGVNIRELALNVLLAVEKEEAFSHTALSSVRKEYAHLSKQERSFLTRLVEGVLERQIEMDYIIGLFSNVGIRKMKPAIRCILRMGVYQLKYMDATPSFAACNEAVRLAQKKGFRNLKPFVNGVLRKISGSLDAIVYPEEKEAPLLAWSVRYSIPEWMLAQWSRDYGMEKAKSIAEAFTRERRLCIRVNKSRVSAEALQRMLKQRGFAAERASIDGEPEFDYALYLSGCDALDKIPEFSKGYFTVQDVCSMLVVHLAAPRPGDYVIDVCSAPGGKSLHAAEWMRGTGLVEARDITPYKTGLIEENIRRMELCNIRAVVWDARVLDEHAIAKADLVIADLPCSGLGTMKKKPDIRFRMTEEKEKSLVLLQREILRVVRQYVKPGGRLVFSTCTMDRMENEENAAWFQDEHPQFSLVAQRQFFPDEGEYDGFYIAVFQYRKEQE